MLHCSWLPHKQSQHRLLKKYSHKSFLRGKNIYWGEIVVVANLHKWNSKQPLWAHHTYFKYLCVSFATYPSYKSNTYSNFLALWFDVVSLHLFFWSYNTSQMIYHPGASLSKQWMHCWFNVMAHKPWITAVFVTVCCSMSMHSKRYFVQPFLRSMKLLNLHTRFN